MERTIIVPLSNPEEDRDRIAEQALRLSSFLHEDDDVSTVLVSAISDESQREARREYVVQVAKSIQHDVAIVVDLGDPADVILSAAAGATNPIIVMASHGKHGVPLRVLGSTAAGVARVADCPVLILTAAATMPEGDERIERVLLPMDDSEIADALTSAAINVIGTDRARDLDYHLVEVAVPRPPQPVINVQDSYQGAHELPTHFLRRVASRLNNDGYSVTWDLRIGEPTRELASYAVEKKIDLIIMPAYSRKGANSLVPRIFAELARIPEAVPVLLVQLEGMSRVSDQS